MVILSRRLPILEEVYWKICLETLSVVSPYGERNEKRNKHSNLIDYVSLGYDPDLKAYRMSQRDYDPVLKRFLTPDPLFLENPEKCIESPEQCNLYGYAAGNPVSFVDPSGNNPLLAIPILTGVKVAALIIGYRAMKLDQYVNNLSSADVARQNDDFNKVVAVTGALGAGTISWSCGRCGRNAYCLCCAGGFNKSHDQQPCY